MAVLCLACDALGIDEPVLVSDPAVPRLLPVPLAPDPCWPADRSGGEQSRPGESATRVCCRARSTSSVIEAVVTIVLIGVFVLVAGFGALMVHRLVRATAPPHEDG